MSDDGNPMATAQRLARPLLPRRFYKRATAGPHQAGFAVLLDGRVAKTPAKRPLAVPSARLAEALAAEWDAQGEVIDPATMPMTRLVNAAIDRVANEIEPVRADIVQHAGNDMILYRAEGPAPLIEVEERLWGPVLSGAEKALGVRFVLAAGVVHVEQDQAVYEAVARALQPYGPLAVTALHSMTTLTGSALIALAVARGDITAENAWAAAHADEDWQMSQWGVDEAALAERAERWHEMEAAVVVLDACAQA
jgi:chaperone required for assembly of F1-ATPase